MKRNALWLALVLALVCSSLPVSTPVSAGPCICPQVYAPVICARGKVYPNQCVADCRKAKDCEPLGFPVPAGESVEAPVCEEQQLPQAEEFVPVDEDSPEDSR